MRLGSKAIVAALLSASFIAGVSHAEKKKKRATPASMDVGWGKPIVSLEQMRTEGVVKQRWDISCGAAALSTLLTYDFKDKTPETDIVVWMLHRTDAARVRERHGFSLLDMKHFAQARGYTAEGFSDMSIKDLADQRSAVIVPIKSKGLDHFVVVKGILARIAGAAWEFTRPLTGSSASGKTGLCSSFIRRISGCRWPKRLIRQQGCCQMKL